MSKYITRNEKNIGTLKHIISKKREIEKRKKDEKEVEPPWTTKKVKDSDEYITKK